MEKAPAKAPPAKASPAKAAAGPATRSGATPIPGDAAPTKATARDSPGTGTRGAAVTPRRTQARTPVQPDTNAAVPAKGREEEEAAAATTTTSSAPVVPEVNEFDLIGSQAEILIHHFLYTDNGVMVMWGSGVSGQLGQGIPLVMPCPRSAHTPVRVASAACGTYHTVFQAYDGHAMVSGAQDWGQLGVESGAALSNLPDGRPFTGYPLELNIPEEVVQVSAGSHLSALLTIGGNVYVSGSNTFRQCGVLPSSNSGAGTDKNKDGAAADDPTRMVSTMVHVPIPGERVLQVACGTSFICALTEHDNVYAWGATCCLGIGTDLAVKKLAASCGVTVVEASDKKHAVGSPLRVNALSKRGIKLIAAGAWHAAAITEKGELFTWGLGEDGRLGNESSKDELLPYMVKFFVGKRVTAVACGSFHTCAIDESGAAYAFGNNAGGQCGCIGVMQVLKPHRLSVPYEAYNASCGRLVTHVSAGCGEVYAFGSGIATGCSHKVAPRHVMGKQIMNCFISLGVSSGPQHCMARGLSRVMAISVLGDPHDGAPSKMSHVDLHDGLVSAGLGYGFSIFVSRRGMMYAFGLAGWGQLGVGSGRNVKGRTSRGVPVADEPLRVDVLSFTRVANVSAGFSFAAAVSEDHRVFTWGSNSHWQLGLGLDPRENPSVAEPFEVAYLSNKAIVTVACGNSFCLALSASGDVYSWGVLECCGHGDDPKEEDVPGALIGSCVDEKNSNRRCLTLPVRIAELAGIIQIAAGRWHAMALNALGEVFVWGSGSNGRLGLGHTNSSPTPTKLVIPGCQFVTIGCGSTNSYGITDQGNLYIWGDNSHGQCGVVGETEVTSPRHILSGVRSFSVSRQHSFAVMFDGSVKFTGEVIVNGNVEIAAQSFDEGVVPEGVRVTLDRGLVARQTYSGEQHSIVLFERYAPTVAVMRRAYEKLLRRPKRQILNAQPASGGEAAK